MTTKAIIRMLKKKRKKTKGPVPSKDLLGTGSTLLNLQLSGRALGGIPKGTYVLAVGDSDSGKSWIAMNILAEAANNPQFDDYDLVYNDAEGGALREVERFFGRNLQKRIEWKDTEFTEDFYDDLKDRISADKKFVYILDSESVLDARADIKKDDKNRAARKKGNEEKGDYGMLKPKLNSQNLRRVRSKIKRNGSILIIIAQTRDMVNKVGPGDAKTRPGGRALKFYAKLEFWTSMRENITKEVRGKRRQLGIQSRCQVKKNHVIGRKGECLVPIYHSSGIDDVGSCVDYLVEEGHWKKIPKKGIKAKDFEVTLLREKLIQYIEEEDLERELRILVGKVWKEIEDACRIERKKRYA